MLDPCHPVKKSWKCQLFKVQELIEEPETKQVRIAYILLRGWYVSIMFNIFLSLGKLLVLGMVLFKW